MHGLVLGKFMPPHKGHLHLLEFAKCYAEKLTIVVGSLKNEPIAGEVRHRWMQQLFPDLQVVHLTDENPQYPHEHPDFWDIWKCSLERIVEAPIDLIFCSEPYGLPLANILGANFIPTNQFRSSIVVSASDIRTDPLGRWAFLPPLIQRQLQKRILIFGPESSGKSTLAAQLHDLYPSQIVAEYARTWLEGRENSFTLDDMETIARGQWASEEAMACQAAPFIFCDTDPLTTALWCEELFGEIPDSVQKLSRLGKYDLTLLLEPDLPWQADPLRFRPDNREQFFEKCRQALIAHDRPFAVVRGPGIERLKSARDHLDRLSFF